MIAYEAGCEAHRGRYFALCAGDIDASLLSIDTVALKNDLNDYEELDIQL